jgi:hypothetical protein
MTLTFEPDTDVYLYYSQIIGPVLHDVKYYFVFGGSMLNPILYGYNNVTMRKAFKITFPFLFREKANYVLKRTAAGKSGFKVSVVDKVGH